VPFLAGYEKCKHSINFKQPVSGSKIEILFALELAEKLGKLDGYMTKKFRVQGGFVDS
jgi:hypothetical protein